MTGHVVNRGPFFDFINEKFIIEFFHCRRKTGRATEHVNADAR